MYVVIRRYTGVIDPKEIIRRVREEFLPIISKVEGYRGYHLVDTGTDILASITMYVSKDDADRAILVAPNWNRDAGLAPFLPNPPQVTPGEDVA